MHSLERPGELAGFDEALERLVDASVYKDQIRKSSGADGTGSVGGTTIHGGGSSVKIPQGQQENPAAYRAAKDAAAKAGLPVQVPEP